MTNVTEFPNRNRASAEGEVGDMPKKRWLVQAIYSSGKMQTAEIEELDELADIVEGWPDWTALAQPIKITYQLGEAHQ